MRPLPNRPSGERGAAIVTAMLVVTLAAVVVSSLFWRESVAVRSVENRLAMAQGRWIERAALDWARVILRADMRLPGGLDHLGETWAVPVMDTRMDETVTAGAKLDDGAQRTALLAGQIQDAQARFNLRALVREDGTLSQPNLAVLRKLLTIVGKPESAADLIALRVQQGEPRRVADKQVAAQRPPLVRLADLLDVPNLDPTVVAALQPHTIVLPAGNTGVNVNTAMAEVLAAAIEPLDVTGARSFIAKRERATAYPDVNKAIEAMGFDGKWTPPNGLLSVGSSWFLVYGVIRYDRVESQTETLLQRMPPERVEIIWQLRL